MSSEIAAELEEINVPSALHPRRRIVVLKRTDGAYSFAEQYHYVSEYEGQVIATGWHSLPSHGLYSSLEVAAAEGQAWLEALYKADPF